MKKLSPPLFEEECRKKSVGMAHTKLASRKWYHKTKLVFFSLSVSNGRPWNGACKLDLPPPPQGADVVLRTCLVPWQLQPFCENEQVIPKCDDVAGECLSQHCVWQRQMESLAVWFCRLLTFIRVFLQQENFSCSLSVSTFKLSNSHFQGLFHRPLLGSTWRDPAFYFFLVLLSLLFLLLPLMELSLTCGPFADPKYHTCSIFMCASPFTSCSTSSGWT